ncbi:hypothetical protein CBR_g17111 [Chara braunii]|uniref:Uncharacterized protein n=1 Tax=Chara braunii TaxID=69332 RepID=A0A388KUV2_CHABU|nr:hypothetical protein CBR_g17111 [Chara braunii]|eukprot:GBG73772.1 hypothetical protein CBR_g17111 [Chara braunii]
MACSGELGADAWLTTVQVSRARVSQVVAKLRSAAAETIVPSFSWILSERQCLLETTWGLEEGPPPHPRAFIDWPRLDDLMQQYYEELKVGQDLCATLEDRCYDDDNNIMEDANNINPIVEDAINIDSKNNDSLTVVALIDAVNSNDNNNNDIGNNDNNNDNSNNDNNNTNGEDGDLREDDHDVRIQVIQVANNNDNIADTIRTGAIAGYGGLPPRFLPCLVEVALLGRG